MRVQYASFCLPVADAAGEQENLNRFLRGHRAIQTRQELVDTTFGPAWVILVEYADDARGDSKGPGQARVDYREVLSPEDFSVYCKLRELRKKVAEEQNLPVFAVFTNEQLAAMARARPRSSAELMKLDGIGEGKAEKFGEKFIAVFPDGQVEASGPSF